MIYNLDMQNMGLTNKKLFKNNLKLIEIEIFSYCNRICWFCPNSFIDRRTINIEMKDDHYEKILTDLAEIDYAGEITIGLIFYIINYIIL